MIIWVNEQIDPCGLVSSCIATPNEVAAKECHETWLNDLTNAQKAEGWTVQLRTVDSWDDVPVNALKLSF